MPDIEPAKDRKRFLAPADLQLITVAEVAQMLGVHRATIDSLRRNGGFPAPVHLGTHRLRWRLSDVRAWIEKGGAAAEHRQDAGAE